MKDTNNKLKNKIYTEAKRNDMIAAAILNNENEDLVYALSYGQRVINGCSPEEAWKEVINNNFEGLEKQLDDLDKMDINEEYDDGILLVYAAQHGYIDIMKLLIEKGAEVNLEDSYGMTPLYWAAINNNEDMTKFLIEEKGAEVDFEGINSTTALLEVSKNGYIEIVKILVAHGADINIKASISRTPLHCALEKGYMDIAEFLIEKGADVNIEDGDGMTPLHYAVNTSIIDMVSFLIEKGADLNYKSRNSEVALKYPYDKDDEGMVKFMLDNGAKEDSLYDKELTFLEHAKGRESKKWFRKLIAEDNPHNPRGLPDILQLFSTKDFQYTNHDWDIELEYDSFITNLKRTFSTTIGEDLMRLSPTLSKKINSFFFDNLNKENTIEFCGDIISIGWSSESLQDYKPAGKTNKPENFSNFADMIHSFKRSIVLKKEEGLSLLDMFGRLLSKQELKSININLKNIEELEFKIFTDVDRLETVIFSILKENLKHDKQATMRIDTEGQGDYFDIKIVHEGSTLKTNAQDLSDTIEKTGTFTTIYNNTLSLCDWSVLTECKDGKKIIDFRYPKIDNGKPHIKDIPDAIDGFTHRLRFYK